MAKKKRKEKKNLAQPTSRSQEVESFKAGVWIPDTFPEATCLLSFFNPSSAQHICFSFCHRQIGGVFQISKRMSTYYKLNIINNAENGWLVLKTLKFLNSSEREKK